mgnify:CR=1 FL=1
MLDQDQTEATEVAQLPRNKDGSIRKTFVKSVARRIDSGDASGLKGLVGDLHERNIMRDRDRQLLIIDALAEKVTPQTRKNWGGCPALATKPKRFARQTSSPGIPFGT